MILILSIKGDHSTHRVCQILHFLKIPFLLIYPEEKVEIQDVIIDADKSNFSFIYDNKLYSYSDFKCMWNRRGEFNINIDVSSNYQGLYDYYQYKSLYAYIIKLLNKLPSINKIGQGSVNKLFMFNNLWRGFYPLLFLFFINSLNAQFIDDNYRIEKAKKFTDTKLYDSALLFLNFVSNKKYDPVKNILLLRIYVEQNNICKIDSFFINNLNESIDINYYLEEVNRYYNNKYVFNCLANYKQDSYLNLQEIINQLINLDQLVRNSNYLFCNNDSENEIDKYTFNSFSNFIYNNINKIDTLKILELDILLIHWAQLKNVDYNTILKLLDTLFIKELIMPSSYIQAKEILFYKNYNKSFYGLKGLNPLLGIPVEKEIEYYDKENINLRRRKVGLLDL